MELKKLKTEAEVQAQLAKMGFVGGVTVEDGQIKEFHLYVGQESLVVKRGESYVENIHVLKQVFPTKQVALVKGKLFDSPYKSAPQADEMTAIRLKDKIEEALPGMTALEVVLEEVPLESEA